MGGAITNTSKVIHWGTPVKVCRAALEWHHELGKGHKLNLKGDI